MSDTVKYSDGLLTSDEFIKIANENNDANLKLQQDWAKKVYENTYASLERQYNDTATSAGVAKERNLVDADTAYKLNDVKYGAEAEAMGRMGLTGSGMGEYRQAEAYAQNRADRQASYAEYDRVMREAAYNRDQGKLDAEVKYSDAVTNAEINHNNTATGIAERELGYADLERQEIDTAYSGYLEGIDDGTLTLDQIKSDSSWAKLSPEQQTTVIQRSKVSDIKTRIDNGESLKDMGISVGSEYSWTDSDGNSVSLTAAQINELNTYWLTYQAGRKSQATNALDDYVQMAMDGTPLSTIVTIAKAQGNYDFLAALEGEGENATSLWKSVEEAAISGAKMYLKALEGDGMFTESQVIGELTAAGYPKADIDTILEGWKEDNYQEFLREHQSGAHKLSASNISKAEKNGVITKERAEELRALVGTTTSTADEYSSDVSDEDMAFDNGEMTDEEYIENRKNAGTASTKDCAAGWKIQGLGSGSSVDDVDITIGGTTYDLRCGDKVEKGSSLHRALNALATGNGDKSPSNSGEGAWLSTDTDSEKKPGKLVVYDGEMYLYTSKGWVKVVDDYGNKASTAVAAFLRGKKDESADKGAASDTSKKPYEYIPSW